MSMSAYAKCKLIMGSYIEESPNIPEHIKEHAKQHVFGILNLVPEYLGHLELLWRREKDVSNKNGTAHPDKGKPCQLINNCPINVVKCQEEKCPQYSPCR